MSCLCCESISLQPAHLAQGRWLRDFSGIGLGWQA